jgi:hypothetical protein
MMVVPIELKKGDMQIFTGNKSKDYIRNNEGFTISIFVEQHP